MQQASWNGGWTPYPHQRSSSISGEKKRQTAAEGNGIFGTPVPFQTTAPVSRRRSSASKEVDEKEGVETAAVICRQQAVIGQRLASLPPSETSKS
jgi:hypothetical protein